MSPKKVAGGRVTSGSDGIGEGVFEIVENLCLRLRFLAQGSGGSDNLLSDRNVSCSKKATLGGLLDGGWSPPKPSHDEKVGPFFPLGREEKLEMELMIDRAYTMNSP